MYPPGYEPTKTDIAFQIAVVVVLCLAGVAMIIFLAWFAGGWLGLLSLTAFVGAFTGLVLFIRRFL